MSDPASSVGVARFGGTGPGKPGASGEVLPLCHRRGSNPVVARLPGNVTGPREHVRMTSATALLIAGIVGLLVGALATWIAMGRPLARERLRAATLEGALAAMRTDNEALRDQQGMSRSVAELLQPVRDSLESMRRAADTASRERTAAEATITTQMTAAQERYQSLEAATKQLAGALAWLACRPTGSVVAGDHVVYVAEVVEGCLHREVGEPMIRVRKNGLGY